MQALSEKIKPSSHHEVMCVTSITCAAGCRHAGGGLGVPGTQLPPNPKQPVPWGCLQMSPLLRSGHPRAESGTCRAEREPLFAAAGCGSSGAPQQAAHTAGTTPKPPRAASDGDGSGLGVGHGLPEVTRGSQLSLPSIPVSDQKGTDGKWSFLAHFQLFWVDLS